MHGRYSKHLPERLATRYTEATSDAKLLELRDEIGLVTARLTELVERIDTGESVQRWRALQVAYTRLQDTTRTGDPIDFRTAMGALGNAIAAGGQDYQTWRELAAVIEQRRKLVESERRRLIETQQMISSERVMFLVAAITDVIRRHVTDTTALALISAELRALTEIDGGH